MKPIQFLALAPLLWPLSQALPAATQIQLWHSYLDGEQQALNACVQRFNQQQSELRLKAVYLPFDEIGTQIANKNNSIRPDLFIFAHDRLGGWLEQHHLSPLPAAAQAQVRQESLPVSIEALTQNTELYGWPLSFKTVTLVYNPALLKQPPTSTTELPALTKRLQPAQVLGYEYTNLYYHAALLNALSSDWLQQGLPNWQSPAFHQAAKHLNQWYQSRILPEQTSAGLVIDQFNQGQVAMIIAGPWTLPSLKIPYRLAPLPQLDGQPLKPWLTVEGIFLSSHSKLKTEAALAAQALTQTDCALDRAKQGHQLPTLKALYQLPDMAADPVLSRYYQQSQTAVPMPKDARLSQLWQPMGQFLTDISLRNQPIPAAQSRLKTALRLD